MHLQSSFSPQLSNYIKFFQTVSEMEEEHAITKEEKVHLKVAFATKETTLHNKLSLCQREVNESDYRKGISEFLSDSQKAKSKFLRSDSFEMAPNTPRRQEAEQRISFQETFAKELDQVTVSLKKIQELQSTNNLIREVSPAIQAKMAVVSSLLEQVMKVPQTRAQSMGNMGNMASILETNQIVSGLVTNNKLLKENYKSYSRCLLPLMNEAVTHQQLLSVLKSVLNHLICCDGFTYILCKDDHLLVYQSNNDLSTVVPLNAQLEQELQLITENRTTLLSKDFLYPTLQSLFNNKIYSRSFLVKASQGTCFVFHQNDGRESLINYHLLKFANEYKFVEDVISLGWFMYETINQIKSNQFKPLQLVNTIEDLGLQFLRCSKYLLVEFIIGALRQKFTIVKYKSGSESTACIEFKDILPLKFYISNINLNSPNDLTLFKEASLLYNRYQRFIKENYERITFYKFFLRSKEQLLFEFDKKGQLKFQSRPVPASMKAELKINTEAQSYEKIFGGNRSIITNIENYLHNDSQRLRSRQFLNDQEQESSYEIFMCIEEQFFKGFVVIFQEDQSSWVKNSQCPLQRATSKALESYLEEDMQKRMRKTRVQHEAINYINKLEQNNPDMRNSVVSMFMPTVANVIKPKKELEKGPKIVVVEKRLEEQKVAPQSNKNLIFRKLEIDHNPSPQTAPRDVSGIFKHKNLGQVDMKLRLRMGQMNVDDFQPRADDEQLDSIEFNILGVDSQKEKHRIVWTIFKKLTYFEEFKIPMNKFLDFISALEYRYNEKSNPFHNYDHGVQVMQSVHSLILLQQRTKDILDFFTRFTLVFAALCHDVAHTGRTNTFEVNSYSKLAITYHDKSVLEQHHIATTVEILRDEKTNVLCNMPDEQFRLFRRKMTQHILYTDITEHFKLMKDFETSVTEKGDDFGNSDENDIKLTCAMVIHTADFNGVAKKYPHSRRWSEKVNLEFMAQYKEEGRLGYPQLPYMKDLDKLSVMAKSEMSFIRVIVRPLYQLMSDFLDGELSCSLNNLDESYSKWEQIHKENEA